MMPSKFKFLSKLPQHRSFGFEPRYYNVQKEELEDRIKLAEAEERISLRAQYRLADRFDEAHHNRKSYPRIQHQKNMSTLRFLIILNILLIIGLYIFVKVL